MRIVLVVGARPNIVKAKPLVTALESSGQCELVLVHTDQHYHPALSAEIFEDLGLRRPDRHLAIGSGSRLQQLARIITAFEAMCVELKPEQVIVVGDVNSTLGGALAAQSLGIRLVHIEAGLRSGDRSMPEEINRQLTDALADLLMTTTEEAVDNLIREGIPLSRIHFVGNVMIDSLMEVLPRICSRQVYARWGLMPRQYAVATMHRPANVDDAESLDRLLAIISAVAKRIPLVFSVHPRTMASLERWGLMERLAAVADAHCVYPPLAYVDFVSLLVNARAVLTDSGGVQEEATVLGIPCLTLRSSTERAVTTTLGTSRLVGVDPQNVIRELTATLQRPMPRPVRPALWDGRAAERIAGILLHPVPGNGASLTHA
jgi:UDP-N-acetylglucosamine 2-epimerase (non-hydrolysing)